MNIDVKRMVDAGVALGGHALDDELVFECPHQVSAIRFTVSFDAEEVQEDADGMRVVMFLTRDDAHDFSTALADCLCDG